ncbi:MAG: TatD family hydrolase, partial [Gammaproteobacteria bacterium]
RATALGCWFSVGPTMLMAEKARALVCAMPKERVVTETDGPFAQLDGQSAKPWDVQRATATLAELWGMPQSDADRLLHANLRSLVTRGREEKAEFGSM